MSEPWHLRKELSVGTIISLFILGAGSIGAYYSAMGQISQNSKALDGVPEKITRLEERVSQLQAQQADLKRSLDSSARESREADAMTLDALQRISVALARLEAQIEDSQ